jgi:hypothetical protein
LGQYLKFWIKIETICSFIEFHEKNVSRYFEEGFRQGKSPLQGVPLELTEFLRLLEAAFRSLPDFDKICSPTPHSGPCPASPE